MGDSPLRSHSRVVTWVNIQPQVMPDGLTARLPRPGGAAKDKGADDRRGAT
jgi:hypothetical protein